MAKVKYRIGDIVMIPIDDTHFVFGRLLNDASIGIHSLVSKEAVDINQLISRKVLFEAGVFDTNIRGGKWKVIGHIPFDDAEESWPSPKYVKDIMNPDRYSIYYKGELKPATEKEVEGLEAQAMYKPEALVEEIKRRLAVGSCSDLSNE